MPIPVMLTMGEPLMLQAFAALIERDGRFAIGRAKPDSLGKVALIDGRSSPVGWSTLLQWPGLVGFVILRCGQDPLPRLTHTPGLRQASVSWDQPWSAVAESLLTVAGVPQEMAQQAGCSGRQPPEQASELVRSLTPREQEVLKLIADGCSVRQAAAALHLAESTIDNHKSRLMKKLGVSKSIELARLAYRAGIAVP